MGSFHVITICPYIPPKRATTGSPGNSALDYRQRFFDSWNYFGCKPTVLTTGPDLAFTFAEQYRLVQSYITKLPDDDIVLYADAFDTFTLDSPDVILEKYRSLNVPAVFAADRCCRPSIAWTMLFLANRKKRFLDSGIFIISAKAFKQAASTFCSQTIADYEEAQTIYQSWHLFSPQTYTIDHDELIFATIPPEDSIGKEYTISSGRIIGTLEKSSPSVIHFPYNHDAYKWNTELDKLWERDEKNQTL